MTALCPICKYPRAGLDDDARCPECGKHPGDALPPIDDEPIAHRRRLARGARLACLAIAGRAAHAVALVLAALLAWEIFHAVLLVGLALIAAINVAAGTMVTRRGQLSGRWRGRALVRAVLVFELVAAILGGAVVLATGSAWVEYTLLGVIAAGFVVRSLLMAGIINTLALRLRSDKLQSQLKGWLKYAGIAAMTPIVAVVAAALTALIPILAPFTVIAAAPYLIFVGVLVVIALVGSIALHARLASELARAAT